MCLKGPDIAKIFHFLSVCILAFINEGTSTLSTAFTEEPWSWGLSVPISLYLKFALELHSHLGICVGVGLPSLVYWGATRGSIDWYWEAALKFNVEFMKTGMFNLVIALLHFVVSKLVHYIIEWIKDHRMNKGSSNWPVISKLESPTICDHPLLRPVSGTDIFLKTLELIVVYFYNGNIMLLSWCFSGQLYSYEVGKAISWVSLGSSLFVWIKAFLKQFEMPQEATEEKAYKVEKDQHCSIQSMESKDLSTCVISKGLNMCPEQAPSEC